MRYSSNSAISVNHNPYHTLSIYYIFVVYNIVYMQSRFLFLFIIAAALLFRITYLSLIEFKTDEAINLFLASRPVFGHPFPPGSNASSVGILNPPLFNYLMFPIVLLTLYPPTISFFIGLINAVSVGLFFLFVKKYYGRVAGFSASLLLAFSPWLIIYSRKLWPQDIIVPFMMLLLFSLHKIAVEKKHVFWFMYILSFLALFQLHQSTIFFLALITLPLIASCRKFPLLPIVSGFVIGSLPIVPFVLYELHTGCPDCTALNSLGERFSFHSFYTFLRPLQIVGAGNFQFILGDNMATLAKDYQLAYQARKLLYIEYLLLPLSAYIFWKKYIHLRFLVYATFGLPCIYFVLKFAAFNHYVIILTPLLFLFLGVGFSTVISKKLIRSTAIAVFVILIGVSILFNFSFFDLLQKQKVVNGDYGSTFARTQRLTEEYFQNYQQRDTTYQEILVSYYLPRSLLAQNVALTKLVYRYEEIQKRYPQLEEAFKKMPYDARIENELMVYYTHSPIARSTIERLGKLTQKYPQFLPVYNETYALYLK